MKDRNWINLVTSLKTNRCILVLGPDLSNDGSGGEASTVYTEPSALLSKHLSQDLEDEDVKVADDTLISLTQQYEDARELGPSALRSRTASFYESTDFEPSELHRAIAALPFSLIVTTRHDPVLENMLCHEGKNPTVGRYCMRGSQKDNPETRVSPSVQEPLLFRLFGDPAESESLILT